MSRYLQPGAPLTQSLGLHSLQHHIQPHAIMTSHI